MAIDKQMFDILACPKCKGDVKLYDDGHHIVCENCDLYFPIKDNIPVMLIDEAQDGGEIDSYAKHVLTENESIEFYNSFYKEFNDYRRFAKADMDFTRKIFQYITPPDYPPHVLDLGAGTGYFGRLFERAYPDYLIYNADFSIEGFRTAQNIYKLEKLAVMDAYNLSYKPESFDVITTIGLTPFKKEKEEEVSALIKRIAPTLKKGGVFVFVWSSNLSGKVQEAKVWTTSSNERTVKYYNHTREFFRKAFLDSNMFSEVQDLAFIRPLAFLPRNTLFSKANSLFTEYVMKLTLGKLSARIIIIAKR